ncbi:MAG: hypothetical protein CfP315_0308 [Candidatus Improbicoccus pseudotrichonymphae]|uniref:Uncharacterized protein n=1 Tax=Candidatus Improbicoccus pseudotrichonymphae TaxID=3033792 RepID=A0AA48IGU0_9FIRM|nr:MAG: hypothetical protein CfP315_0308 [Candidatus Improbicoccus pseudotrichonymphae]
MECICFSLSSTHVFCCICGVFKLEDCSNSDKEEILDTEKFGIHFSVPIFKTKTRTILEISGMVAIVSLIVVNILLVKKVFFDKSNEPKEKRVEISEENE